MALTLEEFEERFGIKYKQMDIEEGVSIYPRTILVPKCPECGSNLYLYHHEKKLDPFITHKLSDGILNDRVEDKTRWIAACWTENCEFFLVFDEADLAKCPECNRFALELYSLYDHMRFQCTRKAQEKESLVAAGCGMYIGSLI
jgi:hypothetical protein